MEEEFLVRQVETLSPLLQYYHAVQYCVTRQSVKSLVVWDSECLYHYRTLKERCRGHLHPSMDENQHFGRPQKSEIVFSSLLSLLYAGNMLIPSSSGRTFGMFASARSAGPLAMPAVN